MLVPTPHDTGCPGVFIRCRATDSVSVVLWPFQRIHFRLSTSDLLPMTDNLDELRSRPIPIASVETLQKLFPSNVTELQGLARVG